MGHRFFQLKQGKPEIKTPKTFTFSKADSLGVIGPYFFGNARGNSVTVNSEEYVKMLREFFQPQLQQLVGYNNRSWMHQDGATCHISNESIPVAKEMFPNKLFSRREDIPWPLRSPDLTSADFFMGLF